MYGPSPVPSCHPEVTGDSWWRESDLRVGALGAVAVAVVDTRDPGLDTRSSTDSDDVITGRGFGHSGPNYRTPFPRPL